MQSVSTRQLKEMQQRGRPFALINVLSAARYNDRHIPGSQNIPLENESFAEEVERAASTKDTDVIVYCGSKECDLSSRAAERLESAGFTSIYEYEGGTEAWENAGLPLEGDSATQ